MSCSNVKCRCTKSKKASALNLYILSLDENIREDHRNRCVMVDAATADHVYVFFLRPKKLRKPPVFSSSMIAGGLFALGGRSVVGSGGPEFRRKSARSAVPPTPRLAGARPPPAVGRPMAGATFGAVVDLPPVDGVEEYVEEIVAAEGWRGLLLWAVAEGFKEVLPFRDDALDCPKDGVISETRPGAEYFLGDCGSGARGVYFEAFAVPFRRAGVLIALARFFFA